MDKLTDLEICKRIAEIEGVNWMPAYPNQPNEFVGLVSESDLSGTPPELIGEFNPLTNKALCFDLMVKYKIEVRLHFNQVGYWGKTGKFREFFFPTDINNNTQRAICNAIIKKHEAENEN